MFFALAIPAFVAGFLMFLAPCTLPLVPGYLAFISGVSVHDAHKNNETTGYLRKKILWNALFYVLGFSLVFVLLGTLLSSLGHLGIGNFRPYLEKLSGGLILILGLYMTHLFDLPFFRALGKERRFTFAQRFAPGKPLSSFLFGATFALGWSPCIGPILGSILLLASTSGSILDGTLLLTIFSLGLAIPFLLVAIGIGQATKVIRRMSKYLSAVSTIGGVCIALLGFLVLTGNMGIWTTFFYRIFSVLKYEYLLNYY
ncbi:sulfite exporter TauE/SafE family protein [Patescibacteria group bacterium]|nr:sulfite exporter TauE/SafE family protein [Patescibacteria group bacterium]